MKKILVVVFLLVKFGFVCNLNAASSAACEEYEGAVYSSDVCKRLEFSAYSASRIVEGALRSKEVLKDLSVTSVRFEHGKLFTILNECCGLEKLSLKHCIITEGSFDALRSFPRLKEVDLLGTRVGVADLASLLRRCCGCLKKLNLGCCKNLAHCVDTLSEDVRFSELEELDLSFTNLTCEQVVKFVGKCEKLERINLTGCGDPESYTSEIIGRSHESYTDVIGARFPRIEIIDKLDERDLTEIDGGDITETDDEDI